MLDQFLRDHARSRQREYLLTTRLEHDLTAAAAARGYDLLVYRPTVDADGFDLIIDDRDKLLPIQLKSVVKSGKAADWSIYRNLLRPEPDEAELYGFDPAPTGEGRNGGVVLITVTAQTDIEVGVSYSHIDIDVLSLVWHEILPKPLPQRERLLRLRRELEVEPGGDVEVPRSAFLPVPSAEHLLALAGLHSRIQQSWRLHLRKILRETHFGEKSETPTEHLKSTIRAEISQLTGNAA